MPERFDENQDDGEEREPVDPFVREAHMGERVLMHVNELLDTRADFLDRQTESFARKTADTRQAYEQMLARLSPEEASAFRCVLADGLCDLFFANYNALRRRLQEEDTNDGLQPRETEE